MRQGQERDKQQGSMWPSFRKAVPNVELVVVLQILLTVFITDFCNEKDLCKLDQITI